MTNLEWLAKLVLAIADGKSFPKNVVNEEKLRSDGPQILDLCRHCADEELPQVSAGGSGIN